MNRVTWILSAVAVGCCATIAAAQTRPDFSGRWTSEPDPVALTTGGRPAGGAPGAGGQPAGGRGGRSGDMGSGWGSNITITQDAKRLTVEYMFFGRGDMQPPLKFVYALDGSETTNSVMMGRGIQRQTSKSVWQGETLVITTAHSFPSPETGRPMTASVTQTLSLESPASMMVETMRAGVLGGPASTTRTAYRKY